MKKLLTAESVCKGHPDKLCDYISDFILDACIMKDKDSRVACETMATKGRIIVAGEITCNYPIDFKGCVRSALADVGYDPDDYKIQIFLHRQSRDIAGGVDNSLEARNGDTSQYASIGAGDQGTVYGYATDESKQMLPLPLVLSHNICKKIDVLRKRGLLKGVKPDGKAQVTVEYNDDKPVRISSIVVSVQHCITKRMEDLKEDITSLVLKPVFEILPYDDETQIFINPSGRFVEGGPSADTGLTGRKIMVDSYGGLASNGGGAFSGKDYTKVDRSGAYMARFIAKNIVSAGIAKRVEVAISYAIGKADPVAVYVETFGTGIHSNQAIADAVMKVFNMRPGAIIEQLHLRDIQYKETSSYGHFNSRLFSWEDGFKQVPALVEVFNSNDN